MDWKKLLDATVVVALIGVMSGLATSALSRGYDRDDRQQDRIAARDLERCRNAFGYLADETPNSDLNTEQRRALARRQFDQAMACGR